MTQDNGRTRIGNIPTCDECGEQHNEEIECEEFSEEQKSDRLASLEPRPFGAFPYKAAR